MKTAIYYLLLLPFLCFGQATHVQGGVSTASAVSSKSLTLGAAPTAGNIVVCGVTQNDTTTTLNSVADGNSNSYTISAGSPGGDQTTGSAGRAWLAYLLKAPANASATITATWASAGGVVVFWCDEFQPPTGKQAVFDTDAGGGTIQTDFTAPTITPSATGNLLYAITTVNVAITAPTAGAAAGSWTGAAGAITNGNMAEYLLNSGNTSTATTFSPGQPNSTMIGSFTWQAAASSVKMIPAVF